MEYISALDVLQIPKPEIKHVNCGTKMDRVSNGFACGEIHIISGSPKNGKSLALLHSAISCAMKGYKVCYLSLENSQLQDQERLEDALNTYQFEDEDLVNLENLKMKFLQGLDNLFETDIKPAINDNFDIVYIDGSEYLSPSGKNGADINQKGKVIIRELRKYLMESQNKPPLILSWQNNKLAIDKKINEMTVADLSGSYAIAQVAVSIWVIVKEFKGKKNWQMRLLNSRDKYNEDNDTFNVKDNNGNFNLLY